MPSSFSSRCLPENIQCIHNIKKASNDIENEDKRIHGCGYEASTFGCSIKNSEKL